MNSIICFTFRKRKCIHNDKTDKVVLLTSPIRYFRLFQGIFVSPRSNDFCRYVFKISIHTWKSDSLKSYEIFQPILPYFLRSCTTAWKKASTKTRDEKALCGHSIRAVLEILWYVLRKFSFRPLGGSVTTCKLDIIKKWNYLGTGVQGFDRICNKNTFTKIKGYQQALEKSLNNSLKLWKVIYHFTSVTLVFWQARNEKVTLRDLCKIPMGKVCIGSVVSQSLKSGWGLTSFSSCFSSSRNHFTNRWQFCNISHWPRAIAVSKSCNATYSK